MIEVDLIDGDVVEVNIEGYANQGPQGEQGETGPQGEIGPQGLPGIDGTNGSDGIDGSDGVGVPAGGSAGQVLSKIDGTDYNTEWVDQTGGGGLVDSVNGETGVVVLDADDIDDTSTTNKFTNATDVSRLANTSGTNTGDQDLSGLALKSNVLEKDNITSYTPTTDYNPATKKYVDENSAGVTGPASSTQFHLAMFDDNTGKIISDSATSINDVYDLNSNDADDIDDTSTTNKFVTAAEKTQITTNETNISNIVLSSISGTFVYADLTAGILNISHTFGNVNLPMSITDNNGKVILATDITFENNNIVLDLSGYTPITGTWSYAFGGSGIGSTDALVTKTQNQSATSGNTSFIGTITEDGTMLEDKYSRCVANYTFPSDASEITFSGLDLNADGGVYRISLFGKSNVSIPYYIEYNGNASGVNYREQRLYYRATTVDTVGGSDAVAGYMYAASSLNSHYITLAGGYPICNTVNTLIGSGNVEGLYYGQVLKLTQTNITSIKFRTFAGGTYNFIAGTTIKIYKDGVCL